MAGTLIDLYPPLQAGICCPELGLSFAKLRLPPLPLLGMSFEMLFALMTANVVRRGGFSIAKQKAKQQFQGQPCVDATEAIRTIQRAHRQQRQCHREGDSLRNKRRDKFDILH